MAPRDRHRGAMIKVSLSTSFLMSPCAVHIPLFANVKLELSWISEYVMGGPVIRGHPGKKSRCGPGGMPSSTPPSPTPHLPHPHTLPFWTDLCKSIQGYLCQHPLHLVGPGHGDSYPGALLRLGHVLDDHTLLHCSAKKALYKKHRKGTRRLHWGNHNISCAGKYAGGRSNEFNQPWCSYGLNRQRYRGGLVWELV